MEITFAKTAQRDYQVSVKRDDGVQLQVTSFDRPRALPHDLAHFVVENELHLEHGFFGLLAAGVVFSNTRVSSGRLRRPRKRSPDFLKRLGQQPIEAEVLVSVMLDIAKASADKEWWMAKEKLDNVWQPRRSQLQHPLCHNDVRRVCGELRAVEQQWRDLPVGKSITVTWSPHNKRLPGTHNE